MLKNLFHYCEFEIQSPYVYFFEITLNTPIKNYAIGHKFEYAMLNIITGKLEFCEEAEIVCEVDTKLTVG